MKHILCYGDSNTWGYNSETDARFPFCERWTGRLAAELAPDCRIIEEGLCGRTTAYELPLEPGRNGFAYYPLALSSADPLDLVVLMLGTNDRRKQLIVSPEESALALERYIQFTRTPVHWSGRQTPRLLLVSPPEIDPAIAENEFAFYYDENSVAHSRRLKTVYRRLAEQYGCAFLDAAAHCGPGADCVHLDAAGHRALAQALAIQVRQII